MNKTTKRLLALLLAVCMLATVLAACGDNTGSSSEPASSESTPAEESSSQVSSETGEVSSTAEPEGGDANWAPPAPPETDDYNEISEYYYNYNLGEFYEAYQTASAELLDVNKRWALMAIAEAKLLGAAVMMPTQADGGSYAINRMAPSMTTYTWGHDSERRQYALIATEPIKAADRDALKALRAENLGTGNYLAEAKKYLEGAGYTLDDTYRTTFSSLPQSWDMQSSSRTADSYPLVPTIDCLVFYNAEDEEVPALATEWDVSEDGLTWTFKIREGVKWVDSQGREVADLVADDWVAGLQHTCDTQGGLGDLWIGIIKNIEGYLKGDITDFSQVGIAAPDDHTVVFTLEKPVPYFTSMLHYNIALPLSRSYYTSQGGGFGDDYNTEDPSYVYGSDPDHIAYCGPFLISNATDKNSITYVTNPTYWDAANTTVKNIVWGYNDNSEVTKAYNDMKNGDVTGVSLNASTMVLAQEEKVEGSDETWFDAYHYVTSTTPTSFMSFFNVYRSTWADVDNPSDTVSPQTEEDQARTHIAMNNVHFRRALMMACDRKTYMAQTKGDEVAELAIRNSYTPATFTQLTADTTVDINGTATTFPAGTDYGTIVQAQLDADGVTITVYKEDKSADNGVGTGDGFDGYYSAENAMKELELAIAELESAGVTVDESNPIQIDLPNPTYNQTSSNQKNAYKQSVEAALKGYVVVNLTECLDVDQWRSCGYDRDYGYEANYDIYDLSGWGPDYRDPATYLETFLPDYNGYMAKCIGIY